MLRPSFVVRNLVELGLCSGAMLLSLSWGGGTEANDKGIVVTPGPKIRTLQPSYDSHRVLTWGWGCIIFYIIHWGLHRDPRPRNPRWGDQDPSQLLQARKNNPQPVACNSPSWTRPGEGPRSSHISALYSSHGSCT